MPLPAVGTLVAPRVLLREVESDDLADLHAVNGDPEVTRWLPYLPWQSAADATAWLVRMRALVDTGSARQLVVVHREAGCCIGTLLLFRHDEASSRLELGYVIGRAHWRQGLAREAVSAALDHAFGACGIRRVEAEVHPDNVASNALLRALGFAHEGRLRERWVARGVAYDVNAWGLLAGEWRRAR